MHRLRFRRVRGSLVTFAMFATSSLGQVAVPASVLDAFGRSVHGLQKSDFTVTCDKTAGFDSVEEVPALSFNAFSDPTPVFILFDAASSPPPVQGQTAGLVLGYLRKAADERLAVTVLVNSGRGSQLIHDMSTDPKVFLAAMDLVVPESKGQQTDSAPPTPSDEFSKAVAQEVQQLQQLSKVMPYTAFYKTTMRERQPLSQEDQSRRALEKQELESLRQVGQVFQRSRKRKLLIWLTGYFPISVAHGELTYCDYALPYGGSRPKIRPDMTLCTKAL